MKKMIYLLKHILFGTCENCGSDNYKKEKLINEFRGLKKNITRM
jgi:hypothetical protein